LGQKYGSRFPALRLAILALDAEAAATRLLAGEPLKVELEGERILVLPDEVEVRIRAHAGFEAAADGAYVAALSTELSPDLVREGLAREFVRRVQEARKAAGLHVADRIVLVYHAEAETAAAIQAYCEYVQAETLATELSHAGTIPDGSIEISFDEEHKVWVLLKKPG
jgi:isoleucyl-tRNA synthetase